ncbi:c-type cytochrome biogenesis protein CcmI [Gilvimarinus sp. DA14]|uniref:c-type cytochrome biogenesis protein CcmI n=1 Tax=Gilvimarinus sp. DA14 TaxID=2956798 RepID=UPI0020B6998B|nr:c-type cytochrome biogenesis protein CcmI [Gilvimarinus sp. DA14]UTF60690.1 c-type cytochrome biogenesis protein CcmI [Gilvimarinus sp. DA14]
MTVFIIGAIALCLVAVACVIWPLFVRTPNTASSKDRLQENIALYREHEQELAQQLDAGDIDQSQFDKLQLEAKKNLLADQNAVAASYTSGGKWLLVMVALLSLVAAALLYFARGSSGDIAFNQLQRQVMEENFLAMQAGQSPDPQRIRQLIERVQTRLQKHPDNTQYWYLLGNYASQLGDFALAEQGYREVYQRAPNEPGSASELAQVIFLGQGNRMSDEVSFLTDRALEVDPDDTTALGLAGIRAFEQRNFAEAAKHWQRAADLTPPGASGRQALLAGVERARAEAGVNSTDSTSSEQNSAESSAWQVTVDVALGQGLQAPANATLFVFAREYQGSPMPLAVYRGPAGEFPTSVTLDESMAMTSVDRLSKNAQVELVARLSRSGQAMPASGDLEGSIAPVDMANLPDELTITIDTVRP